MADHTPEELEAVSAAVELVSLTRAVLHAEVTKEFDAIHTWFEVHGLSSFSVPAGPGAAEQLSKIISTHVTRLLNGAAILSRELVTGYAVETGRQAQDILDDIESRLLSTGE